MFLIVFDGFLSDFHGFLEVLWLFGGVLYGLTAAEEMIVHEESASVIESPTGSTTDLEEETERAPGTS